MLLDVPATKLDRELSRGAALTWLPTTGEFDLHGVFGDCENRQDKGGGVKYRLLRRFDLKRFIFAGR